MNALVLLSNVLSPSEVDRLRKLVGPPPLPQPEEPSNQRVIGAVTKLLKQKELLGETERSIEELDETIADLRKRI